MPPHLAGRDAEREKFSKLLRDVGTGRVNNIVLYGLRGMGKTVLLNEFEQMCKSADILPVSEQYDRQHSDPSKFLTVLKHNIHAAIQTFSKLEKISTVASDAPPSSGVTGIAYYEPSYEPDSPPPLRNYMTEYLIENWQVVEKGGYNGVVFLFDEFHTIRNLQGKGWFVLSDFIGAMAEVQQKGYKYSLILSGLPILQHNLIEARSYAERMFKSMEISVLEEADAKNAMTEPLGTTGRNFSQDLLSMVVKDTGGCPYFVQFYAKEILDRIDKDCIETRDYDQIRETITSTLDHDFFDQRMGQLTVGHRAVLYAMAQVSDKYITFSAVKKHTDIPKGTFSKNLSRLENKGLIHKAKHGTYQFSLPMLRDYLLRRQADANDQDLD